MAVCDFDCDKCKHEWCINESVVYEMSASISTILGEKTTYYERHRDERLAYQKKYNEEHKAERDEYCKKHYRENAERKKKYSKDYYREKCKDMEWVEKERKRHQEYYRRKKNENSNTSRA